MAAPAPAAVTSVVIVDDHHAFADLLTMALNAEDDFEVLATASTGEQALQVARREQPAMVLMDIELGNDDGLEITRDLRAAVPDAVVVMVSAHTDANLIARAADAGASAFAPKTGSLSEMLSILRKARRGAMPCASTSPTKPPDRAVPPPPSIPLLTAREHEVLVMMGRGASPSQISRSLGISVHTCRGYVKAIHGKLDARSQLEAVVIALRLGLIDSAP